MDGVLIINKPKGFTSHDTVNVLRKELGTKKIGHTGTLDPNATGVLPVLIGNATKISKYLIEHDKTYIVEMKLGERTDTLDIEGQVIEKRDVKKFKQEEIEKVLNSFIGKQMQTPPEYSAIKIHGKKAYEYARKGEKVVIPPREIEIYKIKFLSYKDDIIEFQVNCSKGTYIRTLCEDIASKLGTISYMKELKRTEVDLFKIQESITIEDIKKNQVNLEEKLISIEEVFKEKPNIILDERKLRLFLNGVKLTNVLEDGVYRIYHKDSFIGLGTVKNNLLKRDLVI